MELAPAIGGALAGACGTTALLGTDALARAVLGRRAVFAPSQIARRLLHERFGASITKREARHLGAVMRAGYGMTLGALLVPPVARNIRSRLAGACVLAATITGLEVVLLPRLGATPRWSRWSTAEKRLLPLHTACFGLFALTAWRSFTHRERAPT
jgi:hypothetical protein